MSLKRSILSLISLVLCISASAQKVPLTHDVYDGWKSIQSVRISDDGNWAGYRIAPQVGDVQLELRNLNSDKVITIDRVSRYEFSANSAYVVAQIKPEYEAERALKLKKTAKAKMPKDSLYVVNLASGDIQKIARVKNHQLPEDGSNWVAWLHEKPLKGKKKKEEPKEEVKEEPEGKKKRKRKGKAAEEKEEEKKEEKPKDPRAKSKGTELVLYDMEYGAMTSIKGVMEYHLTDNGKFLFYELDKVDSLNPSGIFALETETGMITEVSKGLTDYKKMTSNDSGDRMAFFGSASKKDDDHKYFSLFLWNAVGGAAQIVADTATQAFPDNWMVNSSSNINFSESGERMYFGSSPRPVDYEYEDDTTLLKEDRPDVDVWSYNDPYIQPMQKLNSTRERNRTYSAVLHLNSGQVVQLADPSLESVYIDDEVDLDFVLAMNDKPYRTQYTWDVQLPRDFYKVDVKTGEAELLVQGLKVGFGGNAQLSPNGKYMTWYNLEQGHWFSMDVASKEIKNITENIEVSFANELHDSPSLANGYGAAGWSENDKSLLIYDRYDVWKVDPSGNSAAQNITNGYGRKNKITLRYQRLDAEEQFIDVTKPVTLRAFNEWTKASGFMRGSFNAVTEPVEIVMKDMAIYGLQKAKDADRVLVRMSTYEEYPEVYSANNVDMDGLKKLTDVDAQEDPYNWGTAELVEFNNDYDGEKMQAILYKPENFDPNKKYPMIVYFYERRSNSLHNHMSPAPSASTVNIPYYVSNDYLVLVPDIKYELGYPGKSALEHVVPATNAVVDMGFVDKDKMAIQGQSWGGYQVAYIVTRTNMYAAAGAGAPVSNMTSAYGGVRWGSGMSRMFQYEKTQSRLGATLWERPDLYIENSPLFKVPDIETPLFIMHNDADGAVPWYQGIEFYMSLRRLQKPSWMVVYNGEAHNLRQRKNRKDLSVRMGQFFNHYLKGEPMPEWMAYGLPATMKGKTLAYDLVEENKEKVKEGESLKIEKTKGQN